MLMKKAIYTNREGSRWELVEVVPSLWFAGFHCGRRVDNGQLVHVHEHRLEWLPAGPELEPATAGTEGNGS